VKFNPVAYGLKWLKCCVLASVDEIVSTYTPYSGRHLLYSDGRYRPLGNVQSLVKTFCTSWIFFIGRRHELRAWIEIVVAVGYDKTKSWYKDLFWSPVRDRQPYWVDVLSVCKPTTMKNYTPHRSASWSQAISLNAASKHHYSPGKEEENIHEFGSHSAYAHGQITGTENVQGCW